MQHTLGATPLANGHCRFVVWAPAAKCVSLRLHGPPRYTPQRTVDLSPLPSGYFGAELDEVVPGARYSYRLDDGPDRPDPCSRHQPDGVHEASEVVDLAYPWLDVGWRGLSMEDHVLYELHVGTFSPEGTFAGVIPHLTRLRDLGITAIELMPVAAFPGQRNWGYDGVLPFAVQTSYGGPRGLQRLVDACHATGLAVVLDVVYNHLGPEGNYLADFGPYFTDTYHTPWGKALNFDGRGSDQVREYFIWNAVSFIEHFHIDGLRLDAVHAIYDRSALPFLEQLAVAVQTCGASLGRQVMVMAESSLNDPRLVRTRESHGFGMDAMWADDFHHALHALLTGERDGYYTDFGCVADLAHAWRDRLTYAGRYSRYRGRHHGRPSEDLPGERLIICSENHDQVGNRMLGERLITLAGLEGRKLATACVLLSPYTPLLFMGEEYGEPAPFPYFVSHGDADLIEAVRTGRAQEFASFAWQGEVPDPQDEATCERARVDSALREDTPGRELEAWYRELLALRRQLARDPVVVRVDERTSRLDVWTRELGFWLVLCFAREAQATLLSPPAPGPWNKRLDSAGKQWAGPGATLPAVIDASTTATIPGFSCALYLPGRLSAASAHRADLPDDEAANLVNDPG